jgi:hypothetical protein
MGLSGESPGSISRLGDMTNGRLVGWSRGVSQSVKGGEALKQGLQLAGRPTKVRVRLREIPRRDSLNIRTGHRARPTQFSQNEIIEQEEHMTGREWAARGVGEDGGGD